MFKLLYFDCDWEEKVLNIVFYWLFVFMFWLLGFFFFIELWVNDSCDRVREVLIGRWLGLLLKEGDIVFINGGI